MAKVFVKRHLAKTGWLLLGLILMHSLGAGPAMADEVYLKDGQRLVSPRVWVAGDYAHFILQGTAKVEIRYALEIIDRIVTSEGKQIYPPESPQMGPATKTANSEPVPASPKTTASPVKPKSVKTVRTTQVSAPVVPNAPNSAQPVAPQVDTTLLRAKAKKLRHIPFYDPRRKEKYWASAQSRHNDVNGAVNALAELFGRTPKWVTTYMGTTNDLGEIYLNLTRQLENWNHPPTQAARAPAAVTTGTPRPATATVPPSNKRTAKAPTPHRKAVRADNPFASNLPDTQGPYFYNPRRPKKFWANETARYDSLDDALKALADQYGRSVKWVEAHMGESNSLEEIHHNLTQAAAQDND